MLDDRDHCDIDIVDDKDSLDVPGYGSIARPFYLTRTQLRARLDAEEREYLANPSPFSDRDPTLL